MDRKIIARREMLFTVLVIIFILFIIASIIVAKYATDYFRARIPEEDFKEVTSYNNHLLENRELFLEEKDCIISTKKDTVFIEYKYKSYVIYDNYDRNTKEFEIKIFDTKYEVLIIGLAVLGVVVVILVGALLIATLYPFIIQIGLFGTGEKIDRTDT